MPSTAADFVANRKIAFDESVVALRKLAKRHPGRSLPPEQVPVQYAWELLMPKYGQDVLRPTLDHFFEGSTKSLTHLGLARKGYNATIAKPFTDEGQMADWLKLSAEQLVNATSELVPLLGVSPADPHMWAGLVRGAFYTKIAMDVRARVIAKARRSWPDDVAEQLAYALEFQHQFGTPLEGLVDFSNSSIGDSEVLGSCFKDYRLKNMCGVCPRRRGFEQSQVLIAAV